MKAKARRASLRVAALTGSQTQEARCNRPTTEAPAIPKGYLMSQGSREGSTSTNLASPVHLPYVSRRVAMSELLIVRCLLVVMTLICFTWTVWLILLAIRPNDTVNWIMDSENFDNGTFWLIIDPPSAMVWFSVVGLSIVASLYVNVLVKIIVRQSFVEPATYPSITTTINALKAGLHIDTTNDERNRGYHGLFVTVVSYFTQDHSLALQFARVVMKFVDLSIEAVFLSQILEAGSPIVLVASFSVIVAMNALCCAMTIFLPNSRNGLTQVIVDIIFDFLVVVGYPILTVSYCLASFKLDRDILKINLEVFPDGWFERNASVIANPVYTEIIYKVLKSLQIFTMTDFLVRVGVNLVFAYRLYQVARMLRDPRRRPTQQYPKRHRLSAILLFAFVMCLIIVVMKSIRTSTLACKPHPECTVKAHRWVTVEEGSLNQCPCLTMIDGNLAPSTYEEWTNPRNITNKVIQLATTGDLRTIQLTNRYLPVLPEELRRCQHMRHVALVYTQTESLPDWFKEFTQLEYLYIEGSFSKSLTALPDGMFDDMGSLTFIHLGMHMHLKHLPSFQALKNLKALTLALLVSLVELPEFNNLHNLERLLMISLPTINTIPDLKSLKKLKSFVVNDRGSWCCNGFLGECNLQDAFCGASWWFPPAASCLPAKEPKASPETLAVIKKFDDTVCHPEKVIFPTSGPPTPEGVAQCNGTLYRQCHIPGYEEAMCYNTRFMAISCDMGPLAIRMRRRQFQLKVGDPCHPEYEAWLGCKQ